MICTGFARKRSIVSKDPSYGRAMLALAAILVVVGPARLMADTLPPERINYQGVLRDQNDVPLTGTYDMWFRFFDDAGSAGNEILIFRHTAALGNPITVSGGLLDVAIGSGFVTDGSGPGIYTLLSSVFRDYSDVWLEIQVNTEILSPRTKIQSTPYSLNTRYLAGHGSSYFLDTSSTAQSKTGQLSIDTSEDQTYALHVFNSASLGWGLASTGGQLGIKGQGLGSGSVGGSFTGQTGAAFTSQLTPGIVEIATSQAGIETNTQALFNYGGRFRTLQTNSTGVLGSGTRYGGDFSASTFALGTGVKALGIFGIEAQGNTPAGAGGLFTTGASVANAKLAVGSVAVEANGASTGGIFKNLNAGVEARLADGLFGISAEGTSTAGLFTNATAGVEARLADGLFGISAKGTTMAGLFTNSAAGVEARLANGQIGITAAGPVIGGRFTNSTVGVEAKLADTDVGISSGGPAIGSYFYNGSPSFSYAYIPYYDRGIRTYGEYVGGDFHNFASESWAYVGYSTYKIFGSGSVSFVQNHPTDASKAIVYAAPEGDEVAVYTRGSGRLIDGEARIKLGETFALVTNPDIGLTATATPRGDEPIALTVSKVTPGELFVRGPAGSSATFDYMVWGLRIGFEEQSIVQPKQEESKIPSMHQHAEFYGKDPSLRRYSALARFEGMDEAVHGKKPIDYSRADALRDAIGVNPGRRPADDSTMPGGGTSVASPGRRAGPGETAAGVPSGARTPDPSVTDGAPAATAERESSAAPSGLDLFVAQGAVEPGDVVSLAIDSPGAVVRSDGPADALAIGCVQIAGPGSDTVAVAASRIALCRVSAAYGSIAVGDRLSPSLIAGTAMKAEAGSAGAVILGRAIEPLESGTALVRVLLGAK